MALLTYNGISLPYTNTTRFFQEALGDSQGDTDLMLIKFDITVQCLINSDYVSLLAPDLAGLPAGATAAQMLGWVRTKLMQRRKKLSFQVEGNELIPQQATVGLGLFNGAVDADNGPVPENCHIQSLPAGSFLLTYRIRASYWESYAPPVAGLATSPRYPKNQPANIVLSNRWTETVDIDNFNRSRITREGKYVIASNNPKGYTADLVRDISAVLALRTNFLRVNRSYHISADGLSLTYRISDQEQWRMPPPPSYKAEGTLSYKAGMGGSNSTLYVRCTLYSDNLADQALLARACVGFAMQRLMTAAVVMRTGTLDSPAKIPIPLVGIGLEFDLFDNKVTFTAGVLVPVPGKQITTAVGNIGKIKTGAPFAYKEMTVKPADDAWAEKLPIYPTTGSAGLIMHAAGYWDPSVANAKIDNNGFITPQAPIPGEGYVFPGGRRRTAPDNG